MGADKTKGQSWIQESRRLASWSIETLEVGETIASGLVSPYERRQSQNIPTSEVEFGDKADKVHELTGGAFEQKKARDLGCLKFSVLSKGIRRTRRLRQFIGWRQ